MEVITREKNYTKKTELGEFPDDWIFKPINECTNYVDYRGATPKKVDYGITLVTAKNIKKGYIDYSESKEYVEPEHYDEIMSRGKPKIGDILITTEAPLGNVAAVDKENIALAQRVIKYRARESFLNHDYLKYFFLSDRFQENLYTNSSGSTATGIKGSVLHKLPICFPKNLAEQQAIASALSDVDELIRSLDGLIQKKQAIKKGAMQQLLTGKKRLPGFDGEWEVKRLGECFDFLKTGTQSRSDLNSHGDVGYIHYGDIHSKWDLFLDCDNQAVPKIDIEKIKSLPTLQEGDLIIADASEDYEGVGKSIEIKNIGERNIVAGLHTMLLRAKNESIADGFKAYITSIELVKRKLAQIATGTTVYGLSKTKLKEVEVLLPKSIEEQKAIAQILSDMDRELQTLRQKREKYAQVKQGMMQELLTGRVRLV